MYTLLSGLYKYMFQKDEYCILILGLDNAGKTTFLEQSKTRFNKNYKGMSLSKITTTSALWTWERLASCSGIWGARKSCSLCGTRHLGKAFQLAAGPGVAKCLWPSTPFLPLPSTTRSATVSSMSSTPQMRRGCPRPSERSRRWSRVRRWTVSPSWCWPTSRTLSLAFPQTCLSIPDIKTAFSDCTSKIGRRDCLTQACSALTGKGVREGIEWMVKCVVRNVHRPPRQRDIT
ncbi:ADP-ribosylation factor-related protein 1 isoform X1 [Neofelis nebulosa]|uniref:ADP-ribosylation factor-related protein 1 isoform X1 n=1 Tax=Neofelis nebulosa TaxID=61452 RepID=UPI00272D13D8|nr:ADP-ribosylation factor-related protein 1 isoform X1 [Neofelis nebulosa]XP_058542250.1 ADP-ribosylation factor-related protein 1 isoform X1 [Neofelis nebulosa]